MKISIDIIVPSHKSWMPWVMGDFVLLPLFIGLYRIDGYKTLASHHPKLDATVPLHIVKLTEGNRRFQF